MSHGSKQFLHIYDDRVEITAIPERHLWQQWFLYFIITIIVELMVCAAWFPDTSDVFTRKMYQSVLVINAITQPLLFFLAFYVNTHNTIFPVNFVGETLVIGIEFLFYLFFVKGLRASKAILFSLTANIASVIIGAIIAGIFNI